MRESNQKTFAEIYRSSCERVEGVAAQKLGRSLKDGEVKFIRNCASGLLLESLEREIIHTELPSDVEKLLSSDANTHRYNIHKNHLEQQCKDILERNLNEKEMSQISSLSSVVEIFFVLEKLEDKKLKSKIKRQKSLKIVLG